MKTILSVCWLVVVVCGCGAGTSDIFAGRSASECERFTGVSPLQPGWYDGECTYDSVDGEETYKTSQRISDAGLPSTWPGTDWAGFCIGATTSFSEDGGSLVEITQLLDIRAPGDTLTMTTSHEWLLENALEPDGPDGYSHSVTTDTREYTQRPDGSIEYRHIWDGDVLDVCVYKP